MYLLTDSKVTIEDLKKRFVSFDTMNKTTNYHGKIQCEGDN